MMNAKCETHNQNAVAVCHHCGRPLCKLIKLPYKPVRGVTLPKNQLCGYIIIDPAFSVPSEFPGTEAFHCGDCLMAQHHEEFGVSLERLKAGL
jgi:hypothetical protein